MLIICFHSCKTDKKTKLPKQKKIILVKETNPFEKTWKEEDFKLTIDGRETKLYTLKNKNGLEVTFSNYGQRIISILTPDKNGNLDDIVLGFNSLQEYIDAEEPYFGATIGRYGNRINKGKFKLNNKTYSLTINNGNNHLHGGKKGFNSVVWDVILHNDNQITFFRVSNKMEQGYPGKLDVTVNYRLTDDNEFIITYKAKTDKPTIVNLTHHSFFNLAGEGNGTINEHLLEINADNFTPINNDLIPTGNIESVFNTPFNFFNPKTIGQDLEADNQQLKYGFGYDHNFVLNNEPKNELGFVFAAKVIEPNSGRTLEIYTDEPGLQFYSGNFLNGKAIGKRGKPYIYRGAFCLETQHFPDSPNHPNFPSTVLNPNEIYTSNCIYKFGIQKIN
jgi:aldose 1-epimerase